MERLTYDCCVGDIHCWQVKGADNRECRQVCEEQEENGCKGCPIALAFDRLAAYEDTGLTPEEVQQMRWIPVEERLPEPNTGDGYWVAKKGPRGNTMMKLAQYSDYGMAMSIDAVTDITWRDWDFTKITDVTHWMPLPPSPPAKGEK